MNKNSDTLLALVAGLVAGTAIGILFAPDKGSNTRDKLSFQLDKYKEKVKELMDQMLDDKEFPTSTARAEGQKIINDAKMKADRLLVDVETLIEEIKSKSSNS